MKKQTQKKILLAVDGSEPALEAVRYVSKIPPFQKMEVVLFNVHSKIPESYYDLERHAPLGWRIKEVRAWERQYEKTFQEYMAKAKKILWKAGFSKEALKVKIQEREKGIALDIAREAKRGYSCVAVGRKGMGKIRDLVLGSTAMKLIEKLDFIPLLVVGKKPQTGTILLALDGSGNSMRTVDSVGALLGGPDFELALIHVIRGDKQRYIKTAKKEMSRVFDKATRHLIKSGFDSYQITTKIITGEHSRAGAIVEHAKQEGYGTIVVGRKGLSKAGEFFMGRVSTKIVHLARGNAVWVVN